MFDVKDSAQMGTYRVKFRVNGRSYYAGEYQARSVEAGKPKAMELLSRRRLRTLDGAEIENAGGQAVALLRMDAFRAGRIEFITVRS